MKKQNEEFSIQDFKIQISDLQHQQQQLNHKQEDSLTCFVCYFKDLPISISTIASGVYFSIYVFWFVHTLNVYLSIWEIISHNQPFFFLVWSRPLSQIPIVGYVFNSIFCFFTILSIIFNEKKSQAGLFFIFEYVGSNLYPYLRYIIEIQLFLSAFFAFSLDPFAIVLFIIACLISVFKTLFLQNFLKRKDEFCCKSIQFSLVFRAIVIFTLVINIIKYNTATTEQQLFSFTLLHFLASVFLVIFYFTHGLIMYRHRIPRYSIVAIIVIQLSLCTCMFIDMIEERRKVTKQSIIFVLLPMVAITVGFLFVSTLFRIRRLANAPEYSSLKKKIFFFFNKFQGADLDEQDDCQIRGWMFYHKVHECKNPYCITHREETYDSKKKKSCSLNKIAQGKVSLIKFYVKCLYQTAIKQNPQDIELKVEYVQFFYTKLKNLFLVMKYIRIIQGHRLTPFQKMRIARLKKLIKEQNNGFSTVLYLKKINMQHIVESQQTFVTIQKLIDIVLKRNALFWRYLSRNEVFLSDMLNLIRPTFNLIDSITQRWSMIVDFFEINRRWKFYFICYSVYIKNQKVSPTMIQDFGNSVEYDSIFKSDNYFIDKTTSKQELYNPIMLFQQSTCFLHASCDEDKMVVTKVSNYFQRNFGYQPQLIIGSTLQKLMTDSVASFHHKMMLRWLKQGRNNNEDFYGVSKIYPKTRSGFVNPCFMFFKVYMKINEQVEYIAMFKRNRKEQMILLVNQDFQIEAITRTLANKVKITEAEFYYMIGLNLLALIPAMAKYTKYHRQIAQKDEDFLQGNQNHKNIYKKQLSANGMVSIPDDVDYLSYKKQINLTGVKFYLPTQMEVANQFYRKQVARQNFDKFDSVKCLLRYLLKQKTVNRFKVQVNIRQKSMTGVVYYQIQINEMQENNRLDKMKMNQQNHDGESASAGQQIGDGKVDMQLFFQMNKKKNKIVLAPSNNIFLKDENNIVLTEINHISNMNLLVRIIIVLFTALLIAEFVIETKAKNSLMLRNHQYKLFSNFEKLQFMLNNQFNMKQLQVGDPQQSSFYVIEYTHQLFHISHEHSYQQVFYSPINTPGKYGPYYKIYPVQSMRNVSWPVYDQYALIQNSMQAIIVLHRLSETSPEHKFDVPSYHVLNNYIFVAYQKISQIIKGLKQEGAKQIQFLKTFNLGMFVLKISLMLCGFLFTLTRLCKVTSGFEQLVSIFIQMGNSDIKNISRYMEFTQTVFYHLAEKNQKMIADSGINSSNSIISNNFQRSASFLAQEQSQMQANANLNKKIKKMQTGNPIHLNTRKATVMIVLGLLMMGAAFMTSNIYYLAIIGSYQSYQQDGYQISDTLVLSNIILDGIMMKMNESLLYSFDKYEPYLKQFQQINAGDTFEIGNGNTKFQKLFKTFMYQNVCEKMLVLVHQKLTPVYQQICNGEHIQDPQVCVSLSRAVNDTTIRNRCIKNQNAQLEKGKQNYNNFFKSKVGPFLRNQGNLTIQDIVQMHELQQILNILEFYLLDTWLTQSIQFLNSGNDIQIMVLVCCFVILLQIVVIEWLVTSNLKDQYQFYRRMHQYLIPEFVMNKEKGIKATLVKQGFMKE